MDLELDKQKNLVKIHEEELKLVRQNFEDGVTKITDYGTNRLVLLKQIENLKNTIHALDQKISELDLVIQTLRDTSSRWEATSIDLELKLDE